MAGRLGYEEIRELLEEFDDFFPTKLSSVVDLGMYSELMAECYMSILKKENERAAFVSVYINESSKRGNMHFVVVKDRFKGLGLEDRLVRHVEEVLRDKECEAVSVELKCRDRETIEFYEKHRYEFERVGKNGSFYMSKKLR